HGGVRPSKGTAFQEENFPTAAHFLCRCPNDADGHAEVIGDLGCRNTGAHGHGGNQVVPTGMTNARQTVVLRTNGQVQRTTASLRDKRGGQVTDTFVNREPGVREHLGEPHRGLLFFKAQFRVGVDTVTQSDDRGADCLKAGTSSGFEVHRHSSPLKTAPGAKASWTSIIASGSDDTPCMTTATLPA